MINVNVANVACPLCGADDSRLRYPATATAERELTADYFCCTSHHLSIHGDIVQCNRCGMAYNNPRFSPALLNKMYEEVEDPTYVEESGARLLTFKRSLDQLQRFAQPPGKMLDVGCYSGAFMQVAAQAGWQVEGVELSKWASDIAASLNIGTVYNIPLAQLDAAEHSYDVITMWDVVEHLTEPAQMFKDAYQLLKPGGLLAVSTHLVDSLAVKFMGTKYPFFMDMHVVHFSRATMKRMLEEQGYRLLKIRPHRRILKLGYFLEKLHHKVPIGKSIIKWLSHRKWLADRFIGIGMLGLFNIYAQKPGES
jgi:SAM-dependent methyltransferase